MLDFQHGALPGKSDTASLLDRLTSCSASVWFQSAHPQGCEKLQGEFVFNDTVSLHPLAVFGSGSGVTTLRAVAWMGLDTGTAPT